MPSTRKRPRGSTPPQDSESVRPPRTQPYRLITSPLRAPNTRAFRRPVPTSETQALFNAMRDAAMADHLSAPSAHSAPMSRSPSATSSISLANGIGDIAIQDHSSPSTGSPSKGKPRRRGPLTDLTKAKAAFYRKIGACPDCHSRKVACAHTHHDLSLFEPGYNNRMQAPEAQRRETDFFDPSPVTQNPLIQIDQLLSMRSNMSGDAGNVSVGSLPLVLRGVGGDQGDHQQSAPPQQFHNDLDEILDEETSGFSFPVSPVPSVYPTSHTRHQPPVSPITPGMPGDQQEVSRRPHLQSPTIRLPGVQASSLSAAPGEASQHLSNIPIGRLISSSRSMGLWECQGSAPHGAGTSSVVSFSNASTAPDTCLRQIVSMSELLKHYELEHTRFQILEQPFLYKCSGPECGFLSLQDSPQCPMCNLTLSSGFLSWETWYYGACLPRPASLRAERINPVPGGAGAPSFQFSRTPDFSPFTHEFNGAGGYSNLLQPSQQYRFGAGRRGRRRRNNDRAGAFASDQDDTDNECRSVKSTCPLRQLVPATLEPMCSPIDRTCKWRQPSRSRSRRSSRSRPCVPPSDSTCPLSAAGRPAVALLLAVGRWLLTLLLVVFLACSFALSSANCTTLQHSSTHGGADPTHGWSLCRLSPPSQRIVHVWAWVTAGGVLGTWIFGAASAGFNRPDRVRAVEKSGVV